MVYSILTRLLGAASVLLFEYMFFQILDLKHEGVSDGSLRAMNLCFDGWDIPHWQGKQNSTAAARRFGGKPSRRAACAAAAVVLLPGAMSFARVGLATVVHSPLVTRGMSSGGPASTSWLLARYQIGRKCFGYRSTVEIKMV